MGRWPRMGPGARQNVKNNHYQHWMLTPWRRFTFVHAVERPITEPTISKLLLGKLKGNTFVSLFGGAAMVHAPSTGEAELRGRWVDMVDDPAGTEPEDDPHPVSRDSHVWDRKIDYAENVFLIPNNHGLPPKHEFGDTKHRFVHYRFVGTTRYREYFPHKLTDYETTEPHPHDPNLTQKKKLITKAGPEFLLSGKPLNVLSSARPAQPDILYVLPTFKWRDTPSGRNRLGRGLRIYMRRGWFSSGVGELLGVVLMPPGPLLIEVANQLSKYVSQWGNDPIFSGDLNTALTPSQFTHDPAFPETAPGPVGTGLVLAETENAPSPLSVQVRGFTPLFDSERKLWYVDLELLPTSHYYTFIRFGLCRYQPDSLPTCEISKVVQTEFAQLLADRAATLTHRTGSIDVTVGGPLALSKLGLSGTGAGSSSAPLTGDAAPQQAEAPGDVVIPPTLTPNPAAGAGHAVLAEVESRPLGSSGDLGWAPLHSLALAAHTSSLSPGFVYWKGRVIWPRRNLPASSEFRLVLREYEIYSTDTGVADQQAGTVAGHTKRRLVYADIFPLTVPIGSLT
jgi:hypothetical protein